MSTLSKILWIFFCFLVPFVDVLCILTVEYFKIYIYSLQRGNLAFSTRGDFSTDRIYTDPCVKNHPGSICMKAGCPASEGM